MKINIDERAQKRDHDGRNMESPMKQLHAYWRIEYIEAPKPADKVETLFTTIATSQDDRENFVLHRDEFIYILMNRYPYNAGHLLVVPLREAAEIVDLSDEEQLALMKGISKAQSILSQAIKPDGFNIGFNFGIAAGAGIPTHLHCHVVPRWNGDTNFMPVLNNTKVLPESMDSMWERLRQFAD